MIDVKKVSFQGFAAYQLENQFIQVMIVPEVGGRIISFKYAGHELLYAMPDLRERVFDVAQIEEVRDYRKVLEFRPLGGYKTWLAPQWKWYWPPYLDLEFGSYDVTLRHDERSVELELASPICRETRMQFLRKVRLQDGAHSLTVEHRMKNTGGGKQEFGLWDVTQMNGQGQVIFPLAHERDVANFFGTNPAKYVQTLELDGQIYAVVNCRGEVDFKFGTTFSLGWMLTLLDHEDEQIGYLKRFPVFPDAVFGHGCAVEVYDTEFFDFFEVEVHGPLTGLRGGEETGFSEEWEIYRWSGNCSLEEIVKEVCG